MTQQTDKYSTQKGANGFDFLIGDWTVKHHRLEKRLAGSTTWRIADATDSVMKTHLGRGNIGRFRRALNGAPYEGMTIRIFNPETKLWSIYWIDTINHRVEPPVHGAFEKGVGVFEGEDEWEGRPVKVRFIWSDITERSARWEQAFSIDGGKTWEVNSIMEFTRA